MTTEQLINEKCESLRAELLKEFGKPKLEKNKWYKYSDSKIHLVCFTDVNKRIGFGFQNNGFTESSVWTTRDLVEATPTEVLEALKAEAVKRGIVKGATINLSNIDESFPKHVVISGGEYDLYDNGLSLNNWWIMRDGQWATTITVEKIDRDFCKEFIVFYKSKERECYTINEDFADFLKQNNLKIVPDGK